jgi:unsaturated chondroitin disaccharide hydrolase
MTTTSTISRITIPCLGGSSLLLAASLLVSCGTAPQLDRETATANARKVAADDALLAQMPATFRQAAAQSEFMLNQLKGEANQPRTFEEGRLKTVGPRDWTSGFFPGTLWYLYEFTGEAKWKTAATDYTKRIESAKDYRGTHDLGFMFFCSYGNAQRLAPDPAYRDVILQASRTLCTRYNPQVGLIRSWDFGTWKYPVIIDNMMNLEMLTWAARETGEARFKEIAVSHADKTMVNHFRTDASSFHVVDYDPATGAVRGKQTHQGFADASAWARGQAWGLYGYTMMFRETGHTNYLEQAKRIAQFILNHPRLPADKIPYWDFDAPDIPNAPRDASAAAIIASALIELSGMVEPDFGRECFNLARQQLLSLSSPTYLAKTGENGGFILKHSTGNKPKNSEVDVPLNYADYYFLEALLRYRALAAQL